MTADPGVPEVHRDAIATDLHACAEDLHALLASATPDQLNARSDGTKWTNKELPFHMVFGFLVVRRLLPLVRLVSSLSPRVGRTLLPASSTPGRPRSTGATTPAHAAEPGSSTTSGWAACATRPSTP
jgi:hypothetical protein